MQNSASGFSRTYFVTQGWQNGISGNLALQFHYPQAQSSRRFSEQSFWCWGPDWHNMEGSGSDPMALMPAEVRSHWNASRVHLRIFCPKGLPCSISEPALLCKLWPKERWLAVLSPEKISKLVLPLWCEKPVKLGNFRSKRIPGFWASYMKSCGLRSALWYLVTLLCLWHRLWEQLHTSSTTPAGSGKPYYPLDKVFSSRSWHQNLGTFYKDVSCMPRYATLPMILLTVWSPLWDQSKALPRKADLHHLVI